MTLHHRPWVPAACEDYVQSIAKQVTTQASNDILQDINDLATENRHIHERECFNLNHQPHHLMKNGINY